MKRYLSPLCLAWCATLCGYASSAVAAENAPGALNVSRPFDSQLPAPALQLVDDDVLAHQTGKYAGASMISGFVLNLVSQWQLPNGGLAVAQGTLSVATNAAGRPHAHVTTFARVVDGGDAPSGANPNAIATGGQSVSVNGISQVTQVAGNYNTGNNAAVIDFNANNPAALPLPGSTSNTSASASDASGTVKAMISFSGKGLSLALQTPPASPPRRSPRHPPSRPVQSRNCCRSRAIARLSRTSFNCSCAPSHCRQRRSVRWASSRRCRTAPF